MKHLTASLLTLSSLLLISFYTNAATPKEETAIFAGGCFWSMQHAFEHVAGVTSTTVGYTGGTVTNPSYQQVSSGKTGHYEAIKITFNPEKISYKTLLNLYWHDTDPTNAEGQFCDFGSEYQPVIFYLNNEQKNLAESSKQALITSKKFDSIATKILPATTFYPAEDYHQHYSEKNPAAYNAYRTGCRRDNRLNAVWGK